MTGKYITLILAFLLAAPPAPPRQALGSARDGRGAASAAEVKSAVLKLGADAGVSVRLRDGHRIEGFVSAATGEDFTVTDRRTGAALTVGYPDVAPIKGRGLSTGAKVAGGVGVGAGIFLLAAYLFSRRFD
jgi:hypothetical protein